MSDQGTHTASIPDEVVQALEAIEHELRENVIDLETVTTFMQLFGFNDACEWLGSHRALYFEALRRCRQDDGPAVPTGKYPSRLRSPN